MECAWVGLCLGGVVPLPPCWEQCSIGTALYHSPLDGWCFPPFPFWVVVVVSPSFFCAVPFLLQGKLNLMNVTEFFFLKKTKKGKVKKSGGLPCSCWVLQRSLSPCCWCCFSLRLFCGGAVPPPPPSLTWYNTRCHRVEINIFDLLDKVSFREWKAPPPQHQSKRG